MRFKGRKPIASYRDTWDVEHTLRPIIGEALRKFIEVKNNPKHSDWFGVPAGMLSSDADVMSLEPTEEAQKAWDDILDKMLLAFTEEEPDMDNYDFTLEFVPNPDNELRGRMLVTKGSEEEKERYYKDVEEYYKRRQEGYELFGKWLRNIWW